MGLKGRHIIAIGKIIRIEDQGRRGFGMMQTIGKYEELYLFEKKY